MEATQTVLSALRKSDEQAFEKLFRSYYTVLFQFALQYLKDTQRAEEIVQDAFVNLWAIRQNLEIQTTIKAYLIRSVRNLCINYFKSKIAQSKQKETPLVEVNLDIPDRILDVEDTKELEAILQKGIQSLPEKCRIIFILSRMEGLSYQEIANELGIGKESVKSQIKIALKKLQVYLADHQDLWFYLLLPYLK